MKKKQNTQKDKKDINEVLFICFTFIVGGIAIFGYFQTDTNYRSDLINQLTNVSLMFIFPTLALLTGAVTFLHSSQSKGQIKPAVIRYTTFDGMALGLGYLISVSFAYSEDTILKFSAFILQVLCLLTSIYLIRGHFKYILHKFNSV